MIENKLRNKLKKIIKQASEKLNKLKRDFIFTCNPRLCTQHYIYIFISEGGLRDEKNNFFLIVKLVLAKLSEFFFFFF